MTTRLLNLSTKDLSATATLAALTATLAVLPSPVQAVTLVTERAALGGDDQIDWSSLGPVAPFNFLPNSFPATSSGGLGLSVEIPENTGLTSPFVFQTLPEPGIPTNFAQGDFILFTGFIPGPPPTVGNPGPLTITFDTPVLGAGAQIAVDDTPEFTAFISAFDNANNLLGTFSEVGTSELALDNSALFLGVLSDTPNISRLVFSSSEPERAFGINTLSLAAVPVAVPESTSTLGLLAFGALGAGFALKRKLDKRI
jgi:hypothetical protein